MTTEQPKPVIDLSHAKEPPQSIDINKAQEADPIEPEEVSGQRKQNPTPDDFNGEDEDPKIGDSPIISANFSGG
ncbi:hypothetical protein [Nostoc sp.]